MSLYKRLKKNKIGLVYIPLGIYWLVLLTATSLPGPSLPPIFITFGDKIKHFGAYMILAILLAVTLRVQDKFPSLKYAYIKFTFIFIGYYGIFDEIHQIFIPGRSFDLLDYVADLLGALAGTFIASRFIIKKERPERV